MCRSIVPLRDVTPASDRAVQEAALQFVRKVSGYRQPSKANAAAFDAAVADIAVAVRRLLDELPRTPPPPRRPRPPRDLQPTPAAGRSL